MVLNVFVYFSSLVIGLVLGGLSVFLIRQLFMNRQIRLT